MTDLRLLPDSELSMIVHNTDYLFSLRHGTGFYALIGKLFIYRPMQLAVLIKDLQEEVIDKKIPYGDNV
jgi:hypothetical protein